MNKNKNLKKALSSFVLLALALLISAGVSAQDKKALRQEKKKREKKERIAHFKKSKAAILDTAFVVPATSIQFTRGPLATVSPTINYLQVIGEKAVLQIGSDLALTPGLNNLGGFTLKGKISNLKIVQKKKKDRVYMSFNLTGLIGTARISLSITGSDKANVAVDGMFSGRAFTMYGDLVTLKDARLLFEGTEF